MAETQQRTEPSERDIFTFWEGSKKRTVDPLKIWTKLWSVEDLDIEAEFKKAGAFELESTNSLIHLAREWFEIPDLSVSEKTDENGVVKEEYSGMTDLEVAEVLKKYVEYTNELKKKRGWLPIPSRLLLPQARSSRSTTRQSADSSSMPNGSQSEEHSTHSKPTTAQFQEY